MITSRLSTTVAIAFYDCSMNGHLDNHHTPQRSAFTLIELVVVVLILGIIAAIAAPKLFDTANDAREASARQSLYVTRDAIQLYALINGECPGKTGGQAGFKSDVKTTMRVPFPSCPVGNKNGDVRVVAAAGTLTAAGSQGWAYSKTTGEFIVNHPSYETW